MLHFRNYNSENYEMIIHILTDVNDVTTFRNQNICSQFNKLAKSYEHSINKKYK